MFNFFNKSNEKNYIVIMLKKIFSMLSKEYNYLTLPLDEDIIKGIRKNVTEDKKYMEFYYNHDVYKRYVNEKSDNFKLSNIKIYSEKTNTYHNITIYVVANVLSGISLEVDMKSQFNLDKIDVSGIVKEYQYNKDYEELFELLTDMERELIIKSHVNKIIIGNTEYYVIKLLDDGDFIVIDKSKRVYEVSHNSFELKEFVSASINECIK